MFATAGLNRDKTWKIDEIVDQRRRIDQTWSAPVKRRNTTGVSNRVNLSFSSINARIVVCRCRRPRSFRLPGEKKSRLAVRRARQRALAVES